ncbi:acyl carrier protein [Rubrobacter aplysinae]|uniref:acyl carrier protein n=1 Tax=Rubrobacter aplysinae TaxID=909625 RepID=UPI00064C0B44|nr:acyl carrier protein [Rubrobacter aplysinae]
MSVDTDNATNEIRDWLKQNVTGSTELSDDYQLIDNGVLTSLQTVELVMFMEQEFGVTVEDDELNEENFATVSDIAALISSKTA